MPQRQIRSDRAGRTWSLRREWSRAFTLMVFLLLLASVATFAGVQRLTSQFRGTVQQLDRQATIMLSLRADLLQNTITTHKLLTGLPEDRAGYLRQQTGISAAFDTARHVFPASGNSTALLRQAELSWQAALTKAGLWGPRANTYQGVHNDRQFPFETNSDRTTTLLDALQRPTLDALDKGLADGAALERLLLETLAGLFALALAVTVYFRRRMTRDLVRPVAALHQGVMSLRAGDYTHRIEVSRSDELGELAGAFNAMTGALNQSRLALTREATHDSLTGLPNRASLTRRLESSSGPSNDRRAHKDSVLFIDVDDFKYVNDSLGHAGGDAFLVELAARLTGCVRPRDLVARIGGDEFAIVITETNGGASADRVAERILDAVRAPFLIGGAHLNASVSIGVAQTRPEIPETELLQHADFAMYMAKGGGKGRYQLFDAEMHHDMMGRTALKADLADAVTSGQLRLDYQPVADLRTGEVVGLEALVRWQHPTLGLLAPAAFIALAEQTGDIEAIGCWVLDTAARQVASWRATMPHCADLWLSVNLSPFQLLDPHSRAAIENLLADPALQAVTVVLEVTETALAADIDEAISSLHSLKRLGVRIAIDDFGTGFSSLSTLVDLPVDILKVDRTFVSGQAPGVRSLPILEGILGLADKLSLTVIAEGIEDLAQLDLLRTLGCTLGQGYLLARPAPTAAIEALLAAGGLLHVTEPAK